MLVFTPVKWLSWRKRSRDKEFPVCSTNKQHIKLLSLCSGCLSPGWGFALKRCSHGIWWCCESSLRFLVGVVMWFRPHVCSCQGFLTPLSARRNLLDRFTASMHLKSLGPEQRNTSDGMVCPRWTSIGSPKEMGSWTLSWEIISCHFFPPPHLIFYTCSTRPPAFCQFFLTPVSWCDSPLKSAEPAPDYKCCSRTLANKITALPASWATLFQINYSKLICCPTNRPSPCSWSHTHTHAQMHVHTAAAAARHWLVDWLAFLMDVSEYLRVHL